MDILMLAGSLLVGILFFWVFETHKYIVKGKFDFKTWKDSNLAMFIWSLAMTGLCLGVLALGGEDANKFIFKFMGLNMNLASEFNGSGVVMGVMIGYLTRRVKKPIRVTWLNDDGKKIETSREEK